MTATDTGKTAARPALAERIRAMLPDHTHVQTRPLSTWWNWTTAGGRWEVALRTEAGGPFVLRTRIVFTGINVSAELPSDEVGLAGLRALLVALGAIRDEAVFSAECVERTPNPDPRPGCGRLGYYPSLLAAKEAADEHVTRSPDCHARWGLDPQSPAPDRADAAMAAAAEAVAAYRAGGG